MSEQDFFFDDEDEKPAKDSKESKPTEPKKAPAAKSRPSRPASAAAAPSFWAQSVNMTVTSLVALIALLLGVIVGIVLPVGGTSSNTVPDPTAGVVAPSLTPEQLQSGQMPEGHPAIGDPNAVVPGESTATPAPEGEAPAGDEAPADGTEVTPSE